MYSLDRKALAAAFPVTLPVLMGYLAIGMAFGFLLEAIGYNFIWAFFMSLTIYAGSGRYLGVTLLASAQGPVGADPKSFYFSVALLDHLYWIAGSVIGSMAGTLLGINTQGIEFAMTALFLVIAVDQWKSYPRRLPALLGAGCALVCLKLAGRDNMLLPALFLIVAALLGLRGRLEEKEEETPC